MIRTVVMAVVLAAVVIDPAQAQTASPAPGDEGWRVSVYPILVWVPLGLDIDVALPPVNDGGSGDRASIVDGRFDGAYLGGVVAANRRWRIEGNFIWAAVGGDRPDSPVLSVDADLLYGYGTVGHSIVKNLFVTAGVRRLALKYDVRLGDRPNFQRKPGIWDPLVGIAYQQVGRFVEIHANFDGGGFGAGADVDLGATLRIDLKPARHFGITVGYTMLYLELTNTVANRDFTVKQTLHGPAAGIGIYF